MRPLPLFFAALSYCLMIFPCWSESVSRAQIQALQQYLEEQFHEQGIVGLQAAVYAEGDVLMSYNLGYADLAHRVPVTAETRFEVASVTKAFTALGLYQLKEAGKVALEGDVRDYVPEFPEKTKGVITVDHLAGFLGGIRHYLPGERTPSYYAKHFDDPVDAIAMFKDDPLLFKPGEAFSYTSYGYNLLAAVIQRASGQPFKEYIQATILNPLGLKNTGYVDVRKPQLNLTRTYTFVEPYTRERLEERQVVPTLEHSYNDGGGNMYSTATDLITFGRQFIEPGFVSANTLQTIRTPHYTSAGVPTLISDGWGLFGEKTLIASGSYPGSSALLFVYPERKLVVALLMNTWGRGGPDALSKIGDQVVKIVIGGS